MRMLCHSETQLGKQRIRTARQELICVADQPNSVPHVHVHNTVVLPPFTPAETQPRRSTQASLSPSPAETSETSQSQSLSLGSRAHSISVLYDFGSLSANNNVSGRPCVSVYSPEIGSAQRLLRIHT